jgi:excisionase family DNA binding protein
MESEETLLNTSECAQRLAICTTSVRRLVRRGDLKACRVGRNIRVKPEDLEKFISGEQHDIHWTSAGLLFTGDK